MNANNTSPEPDDSLPAIKTTPHINAFKVRKTALEMAKLLKPFNKFTRVGQSFLDRIEAQVRANITSEVKRQPSKGITLK